MVRAVRLGLALSAAALVLGIGAQASGASRLSLSNTRFRMVWTELRFQEGAVEMVCPVTLEGTMPSATFSKVINTQIGSITSASTEFCRGGSALFLNSLPWSFKYYIYGGTLPNIESVLFYTSDVELLLRDTIFGFTAEC